MYLLLNLNRCLHTATEVHSEPCQLSASMEQSPEMFLRKGVLKICSKVTGEHPCRSAISIKLLCNFIKIALRHGCSPVNLLHIFRTPFLKNTSGWLLLKFDRVLNTPLCYYHLSKHDSISISIRICYRNA